MCAYAQVLMFELFSDGPVYEYPQLLNVTYSFIWAFVLASLIAITHRLTYTGDYYPKNFFQALILGAVVTAMVMMAVGDSLARGLGVFGAMAIIRFRTRVDDPRDVLFLFAALSTGLAIGVFGFTISFAGTVLFCLIAFLLHSSPMRTHLHQQRLMFDIFDKNRIDEAKMVVEKYCLDYRQVRVQIIDANETRYYFNLSLKKGVSGDELLEALRTLGYVKRLRLEVIEFANM